MMRSLVLFGLVACSNARPPGQDSAPDTDDSETELSDVVLWINELLASNNAVNTDDYDEFDDWAELYNPGPDPIALGGFGLTDDDEVASAWTFPDGVVIGAGAHLVVWCDGEPDQGDVHADLKLGAEGELLTLVDGDGAVVDRVDFPAQEADISYARVPDGAETWVFATPTPGAPNG